MRVPSRSREAIPEQLTLLMVCFLSGVNLEAIRGQPRGEPVCFPHPEKYRRAA